MNAHRFTPAQQAMIQVAVEFLSTPEDLRVHASLKDAALAHGIDPTPAFYAIANSPAVFHQLLISHAGQALQSLPQVLTVVRDYAVNGSLDAAKLYLDWSRKVLTDARFLEIAAGNQSVHLAINSLANSAERMAAFLESLPDHPNAPLALPVQATLISEGDAPEPPTTSCESPETSTTPVVEPAAQP